MIFAFLLCLGVAVAAAGRMEPCDDCTSFCTCIQEILPLEAEFAKKKLAVDECTEIAHKGQYSFLADYGVPKFKQFNDCVAKKTKDKQPRLDCPVCAAFLETLTGFQHVEKKEAQSAPTGVAGRKRRQAETTATAATVQAPTPKVPTLQEVESADTNIRACVAGKIGGTFNKTEALIYYAQLDNYAAYVSSVISACSQSYCYSGLPIEKQCKQEAGWAEGELEAFGVLLQQAQAPKSPPQSAATDAAAQPETAPAQPAPVQTAPAQSDPAATAQG